MFLGVCSVVVSGLSDGLLECVLGFLQLCHALSRFLCEKSEVKWTGLFILKCLF